MNWWNQGSVFLAVIQNKSSREHHTHSEAQRRQHQALGLLYFSQNEFVFFLKVEETSTQQTILARNLWVYEKCHILARTQKMRPRETKHDSTRTSFGKAQTRIWLNIWASLMLHHHRAVCVHTGEAPTLWQIWSVSADKSGQISPSQDALCWWTPTQRGWGL